MDFLEGFFLEGDYFCLFQTCTRLQDLDALAFWGDVIHLYIKSINYSSSQSKLSTNGHRADSYWFGVKSLTLFFSRELDTDRLETLFFYIIVSENV